MRNEIDESGAPVTELARLALERSDGNLDEAARMLGAWARDSARVRDELAAPLLAQACYQAVVAASWYERRKHWRPAAEGGRDSASRGDPPVGEKRPAC